MGRMLDDDATSAQVAALVTALRTRGESPEQVRALSEAMIDRAVCIDPAFRPPVVVDVVGTGGDGSNSVNISTMAALVAAAAGAPVIKHGSRAASSATGSADVLELLGVRIEASAEQVARCVREVGIATPSPRPSIPRHPDHTHAAGVEGADDVQHPRPTRQPIAAGSDAGRLFPA
jgi:Anthranilate phosphoribosyltransferase